MRRGRVGHPFADSCARASIPDGMAGRDDRFSTGFKQRSQWRHCPASGRIVFAQAMEPVPTRFGAKRLFGPDLAAADPDDTAWNDFGPARGHVLRRLRAIRRGVSVLLWTLLCMPVQAVFL